MDAKTLEEKLKEHAEWLSGPLGQRANLEGANLARANLEGAYLARANLERAYLERAYLSGTCLDPSNIPNGDVECFERDPEDPEYIIGYRTKGPPYMGGPDYKPGKVYTAPWFSTADTECHPGLYLCPTARGIDDPIRVRARAEDVHRAGDKWRCKKFTVLE